MVAKQRRRWRWIPAMRADQTGCPRPNGCKCAWYEVGPPYHWQKGDDYSECPVHLRRYAIVVDGEVYMSAKDEITSVEDE